MLVSQPFVGFASQSANPVLHEAMPHTPLLQTELALASEQSELARHCTQTFFVVSHMGKAEFVQSALETQSTHVPLAVLQTLPLEHWELLVHEAVAQTPEEQVIPVPQACPHAPQLFVSVEILVSQPSANLLLLQSANPALQVPVQTLPVHDGLILL